MKILPIKISPLNPEKAFLYHSKEQIDFNALTDRQKGILLDVLIDFPHVYYYHTARFYDRLKGMHHYLTEQQLKQCENSCRITLLRHFLNFKALDDEKKQLVINALIDFPKIYNTYQERCSQDNFTAVRELYLKQLNLEKLK